MYLKNPPKFILEIAVFLCGAAVMVFELAGARLLAPYLGTSFYIWTGIIGVVLASLSLGYFIGGKVADKKPRIEILSLIIFSSACLVFISAFMSRVILPIFTFSKINLEVSSVLCSFLLFAPASVLFGFISPYVVKLKMQNLSLSGSTVGNLYSISTLGSIFGTFSAGFFLLPFFGTIRIILVLSFTLVLISLLVFPWHYKNIRVFFFGACVMACLLIFYFLLFFDWQNDSSVLLDRDTLYNRIQVKKIVFGQNRSPVLVLSTDPFVYQSAMNFENDDFVSDYLRYFDLAFYFKPDLQNTLLLGGSAFIYPKNFSKNHVELKMDIVEIDPAMIEVAKQFFRFQDSPNLKVFHQDGRTFLNSNQKKYDVIFSDVFGSALSVPFQLTTRETAKRIYESLSEDGLVLINLISPTSSDSSARFLASKVKTYQQVFPQVLLFLVKTEKTQQKQLHNIILVALKSSQKYSLETSNPRFSELLKSFFTISIPDNAIVLTDDFAPVEYFTKDLIRDYY